VIYNRLQKLFVAKNIITRFFLYIHTFGLEKLVNNVKSFWGTKKLESFKKILDYTYIRLMLKKSARLLGEKRSRRDPTASLRARRHAECPRKASGFLTSTEGLIEAILIKLVDLAT
jgi:hypothetical protein